ncbi:choline/glycine/proline betaine transport protein [Halogranum amylolyticum]|uniref:Choline/glycine/proline betaine transport protein n=1 Tax=Halogranum amylolyticum TaxID=660520 RepID=A0A1H8NH88_9EURY|nr:BCCT family transporter [Halogranum amylolyticum]SEO28947.1 choline/glycine/proline betaine transport protein [Halogranum amylolyticum]
MTDGDRILGKLQVEVFHPDTDREPGDDNVQRFGLDVHPVVFPVSLAIIVLFIALTLGLGDQAATIYQGIFDFINETFGWFYVLAVNVIILALGFFALSKYGMIRIGGPEAEKEFDDFEWMAMLFSAGMGIGLLFFGVAEPMEHFASGGGSFFDFGESTAAAGGAALGITYFHWGLHPWAIYGLVGLGLAFFSFNRGLPLTFRSIFWPLLGKRIYGWPGHLIDLTAVFATLFGLATALGLGVKQMNTGLAFVAANFFGSNVPTTIWVQISLIALITAVATLSVAAGLEGGVKRLSKVNVYLMFALLGFMILAGPTQFVLDALVGGLGVYLGNFLELSFYTESFAAGDPTWQHTWTIFYWGFWIAWSPFVGLFIARISKGRTIREFIGGVLVIPSLVSFLWVSAFGGSALFVELHRQAGGIVDPLSEQGQAVALFELLSFYPLTLLSAVVATLLLGTFFVTSSDSGSLVIDHLTAGGKHDVPKSQRVMWAITEGAVAAVLLLGNGLNALRTASITTGLPFAAVLLLMVYTIYLGLDHELEILESEAFSDRVEEISEDDDVEVSRESGEIVTDIQTPEESAGD